MNWENWTVAGVSDDSVPLLSLLLIITYVANTNIDKLLIFSGEVWRNLDRKGKGKPVKSALIIITKTEF